MGAALILTAACNSITLLDELGDAAPEAGDAATDAADDAALDAGDAEASPDAGTLPGDAADVDVCLYPCVLDDAGRDPSCESACAVYDRAPSCQRDCCTCVER